MSENIIEIPPAPTTRQTVGSVWAGIWANPVQLLRRWNYKSAIFSSIMRSSIFLITYLQFAKKENSAQENLLIALGAAGAQFAYRFLSAGIIGALVQSFRRVEPPWQAFLMMMLLIPAISHFFEFLVQIAYANLTHTTGNTDEAILRSVSVSIISTLFNLFAMRRGVLLVGADEDRKTMWGDIKHIPVIVFKFVAFVPTEICKMLFQRQFIAALISIVGFGMFAEILCWAVFSKPFWTYSKGKAGWYTVWGVDAIFLLLFVMIFSAIYLRYKGKYEV